VSEKREVEWATGLEGTGVHKHMSYLA